MNRMNACRRPLAFAGLLAALLAAVTLGPGARPAVAADLPARPEQLKYPPLKYAPPKAADYRVKLASGIPAYLAPDKALPLVTVTVLMRVGPDLDPAGKEGLAATMMHLLTRSGTKDLTAEQLEERLAFLGAQLESGMGGGGGMMGLGGVPISGRRVPRHAQPARRKDLDEGLALLTDCLKGAAFQEDRLKLRKDQQLQNMKQRNDATSDLEEREWGFLMRGADHWTNRYPTEASINVPHAGRPRRAAAALRRAEELRDRGLRRLRPRGHGEEARAGVRGLAARRARTPARRSRPPRPPRRAGTSWTRTSTRPASRSGCARSTATTATSTPRRS